MAIKTAAELAAACRDVARDHKTLYIMGCFGAPMNAANKARYTRNHSYNRRTARKSKIHAASAETFGFDCVGLIKGLLWGWEGELAKIYGGARYGANNVPDLGANQMIQKCSGVSTDFSTIQVGEVVWMEDHIGVYLGDGLAVECAPAWKNGVQITAVHNIGKRAGYNGRTWTKHGRLPYVAYPENRQQTGEVCEVKVKILKQGAKGGTVRALQVLLAGAGHSCGSSGADGSFGPATHRAVCAYQQAGGLEVDGSVGPATWASLLGCEE